LEESGILGVERGKRREESETFSVESGERREESAVRRSIL